MGDESIKAFTLNYKRCRTRQFSYLFYRCQNGLKAKLSIATLNCRDRKWVML